MSFVVVTLCVASQRMFIVVVAVYVFINSIRKVLDTPSCEIKAVVPDTLNINLNFKNTTAKEDQLGQQNEKRNRVQI
jgi:hypothetical protein